MAMSSLVVRARSRDGKNSDLLRQSATELETVIRKCPVQDVARELEDLKHALEMLADTVQDTESRAGCPMCGYGFF